MRLITANVTGEGENKITMPRIPVANNTRLLYSEMSGKILNLPWCETTTP